MLTHTSLYYTYICMRSDAALRLRAQAVFPAIEQMWAAPFFQQFEASAPHAAIYMGGACNTVLR